MSAAVPPAVPGAELLPSYEVIAHLSRGRRLDVYDAWSSERGCRCILKSIRPERAGEQRARQLLVEEGELLARLTHPHLVRAYETLLEPVPAIVMETLSGETVGHMIESGRTLSAVELGHLALHLGSAVRYLHAHGILHLDLKPSNVVADSGRAKLIDLSVARAPGAASAGIGTPDYMAPEQARGGDLGPAADVWGIGVVLFEAATGARAFRVERSETGDEPSESWSDDEGESWTDDDEEWSETPSWETGDDYEDEEYAQLEGRAERLAGREGLTPALAALVDDCLEPEAGDRPGVEAVLGRAEQLAEVPVAERRWS